MIAVIFELEPAAGAFDAYMDLAAALRPELEKVDGFVSVERFRSMTDPDRYLSLSFWRDEEAVRRWRCTSPHRNAQQAGRSAIFRDYRLRVASVVRDYSMTERDEAPGDSRAVHAGI